MAFLRFSVWIGMAVVGGAAFGQYGLYGSPDLVDFPTVQNASVMTPGHVARPVYPSATAQVPQAGWRQGQPSPAFARRPLLQFTSPAAHSPKGLGAILSRYAAPRRVAPQYVVPPQAVAAQPAPQSGYAVPHQAIPVYAAPTMVQPHPAVADYYTPDAPKPADQAQQAIPVPPTPPGMSDADAIPSDLPTEVPSPQVAPPTANYLDYNPSLPTEVPSPQVAPPTANYLDYNPSLPTEVPSPQVAPPTANYLDYNPSLPTEVPSPQVAPPTANYLDYNPSWDYRGVAPQAGPSCEAACTEGAGCSPCDSAFCAVAQPCLWYGGAKALFLSRNDANRLWTSYEFDNEPNQLMRSDMIGLKWRAGGEVTIGRRFGCCTACDSGCGASCDSGCGSSYGTYDIPYYDAGYRNPWSLQATYFTMEPFNGYHSVTHANGVSSVLTVGNVYFHGLHASDWFDQARRHELWRRNEIHSVEVSFVRGGLPWMDGSRFDCNVEFGVRYFRFWEHLLFGATAGAGRVDPAYAQQAFLEDKVSNDLFGFQFGFDMGYQVLPSCRLFAAPKFGVYNNHIDHYFVARLSDGTVGTVTSPAGETFPSQSNTNVLSFLTQIDVGLDWQLTQRLSAQMGYRVIVATGMALADHQIPHYVNDIPEYRNIKHNGDLFLHGAFAGVTLNY